MKTKCKICPRQCDLEPDQSGFCHVRKNVGGKIHLTTYGYTTGLNIDPIEKKPLYHFYPGSKVLSFGTIGCNMGCAFCQNAHLSRSKEEPEKYYKASPEEIVDTALRHDCKSIAYTYNDPIIFIEYMRDTAKIAHEKGLKNVAITAGNISPEFHAEFFEYIDAANIDLKAFNDDFYKKHCLASLEPVLETIKYACNAGVWLELTTLLIEGENDSTEEITKECAWIIDNLGVHVPLHFSAFFPAWKFSHKNPTRPETLLRAYEIARDMGLKYVYTGNIPNAVSTSTTYCENCNSAIIIRDGYSVVEYDLENGAHCRFCGFACSGRFEG